MAVDTFIVFAGVYDSAADAEADYEVIKDPVSYTHLTLPTICSV